MDELETIDGFRVNTQYVETFKTFIGVLDSNTPRYDISDHIRAKPSLAYVRHERLYELNPPSRNPLMSSINVIVVNIYDYKIWKDLIPDHVLIRNETIEIADVTNHTYIFVIHSLFGRFMEKYDLSYFARVIVDNAYTSVLPRISFSTYPGFIWLLTTDRSDRDKPKSSCISSLITNMVPHVNLRPKCFVTKPCHCQVKMSITIGSKYIPRDECPICYEQLDQDILMSTCCRNAYHKRCYDNRSRCIICNSTNHTVIKVVTDGVFTSLDEGLAHLVRVMDNPIIYVNRLAMPRKDKKILRKFPNVIPSDKQDPVTLVKDGKCVTIKYLT